MLRVGGGAVVAGGDPRRGARRRGARARFGVHLRALQHQRSRDPVGRGGRGVNRDRDRDRRDEPQHAPPDGHRVARNHHASPQRRSLRARARSRDRTVARCLRHPAHHDCPTRRLRRADAPAVEGRDDLRPRRTGRDVPVPLSRFRVRRRHPAAAHRVRPALPRARRARVRRRDPAHLLHRRDARAMRTRGEGRGRAGGA